MFCIRSPYTDVYYNLALEEYLLRNFNDDFFILYIDNPAVVIGKHQNALAEVNLKYITQKDIKLARRLSGGGTVYHDSGNLNFSFISTSKDDKPVNFRKYQKPVVDALSAMGLTIEVGKRNDLFIENFKVSGNAEHIFKNRVLHHGTLLYNSDLETLSNALGVTGGKYLDKAVQSKRSKVANISSFLNSISPVESFRSEIMKSLLNYDSSNIMYELYNDDKLEIEKLVVSKFATWDWNFGYSPKYIFNNKFETTEGKLEVKLHVEKGNIKGAEFLLNGKSTNEFNLLSDSLIGLKHYPEEIKRLKSNFDLLSLLF